MAVLTGCETAAPVPWHSQGMEVEEGDATLLLECMGQRTDRITTRESSTNEGSNHESL